MSFSPVGIDAEPIEMPGMFADWQKNSTVGSLEHLNLNCTGLA